MPEHKIRFFVFAAVLSGISAALVWHAAVVQGSAPERALVLAFVGSALGVVLGGALATGRASIWLICTSLGSIGGYQFFQCLPCDGSNIAMPVLGAFVAGVSEMLLQAIVQACVNHKNHRLALENAEFEYGRRRKDVPAGARLSGRVLVFDDDDRLLLLKAVIPDDGHVFWLTPGGGLQGAETFEAAAIRELLEETGLTVELGPWCWFRRHVYVWNGQTHDQYDRFFVARTKCTDVRPRLPDDFITGLRWWTLREIIESCEDFAPRRMPELLLPLLRRDYPTEPFDCGV